MKTYTIKITHTSIASETNSKEKYNIIVLESNNNKRVITLKDTKLIIEKVSLSENKFLQQSREETLE